MKESFVKPEMEVIQFDGEDIITSSSECPDDTPCSGECYAVCTYNCLAVSKDPAGCSDDLT